MNSPTPQPTCGGNKKGRTEFVLPFDSMDLPLLQAGPRLSSRVSGPTIRLLPTALSIYSTCRTLSDPQSAGGIRTHDRAVRGALTHRPVHETDLHRHYPRFSRTTRRLRSCHPRFYLRPSGASMVRKTTIGVTPCKELPYRLARIRTEIPSSRARCVALTPRAYHEGNGPRTRNLRLEGPTC
jgi:hypothetical protein